MIVLFIASIVLLGFYMAWTIGANDVANSMADAVGSQSCSIRQAVVAAGICEFAGAVLVGAHVTDTVRKGIVDPNALKVIPNMTNEQCAALLALGMMSALLAAAVWLHVATAFGMPVSTTHCIVGAVAGFGVVAAGWNAVHWSKVAQIVSSWFISPVFGGMMSYVIFRLISVIILGNSRPCRAAAKYAPALIFFTFFVIVASIIFKGMKHIISEEKLAWLTGTNAIFMSAGTGFLAAVFSKQFLIRRLEPCYRKSLPEQLEFVEKVFAPLVFLTSCTVAFAHGANDVANAVGPLAAVVEIFQSGSVQMRVHVPYWILILGGVGIVTGLAMYGYRVMTTVGTRITVITPSRGLAADVAAMTVVLICSRLKLPISTTHTLVGAILGVAMARGLGAVNKRVTKNIFGSWLITVPAAALLSVLFFVLGRYFLLDYVAGLLMRSP